MLLKLQHELNCIQNARRFLSIVHVLLQSEGHPKVPFQHTHELQVMVLGVHQCTVQPLQVDLMEVEHQCTAHKLQCMENLDRALHIMDHR